MSTTPPTYFLFPFSYLCCHVHPPILLLHRVESLVLVNCRTMEARTLPINSHAKAYIRYTWINRPEELKKGQSPEAEDKPLTLEECKKFMNALNSSSEISIQEALYLEWTVRSPPVTPGKSIMLVLITSLLYFITRGFPFPIPLPSFLHLCFLIFSYSIPPLVPSCGSILQTYTTLTFLSTSTQFYAFQRGPGGEPIRHHIDFMTWHVTRDKIDTPVKVRWEY